MVSANFCQIEKIAINWSECNQPRRDDDYLGFVAGITASQRISLGKVGISTLESIAGATELPRKFGGSYASLL